MIKITPDQFKKRRLLNGGRRFLHAALIVCALVSFDAAAQEKGKRERVPEREVRGGLQGAGTGSEHAPSRNTDADIKLLLEIERSHTLPEGIAEARREKLKEISDLLCSGNLEDARASWEGFLASLAKPLKPEQLQLFARNLLHEVLTHENADLARTIRNLSINATATSELESQTQRIRQKAKGLEVAKKLTVEIPEIEVQPDGTMQIHMVATPDLTAEQIEALAIALDEKVMELKNRDPELRQSARDAVEANQPQLLRITTAAAILDQAAQAITKKSE